MPRKINDGDCICCGPKISGLKIIKLTEDIKAGIIGMDQIFEDLYKEGWIPNNHTAAEIIKRLKKNNYIPQNSQELYQKAVLEEYKKYYEWKSQF